jgi:hypothetical protein
VAYRFVERIRGRIPYIRRLHSQIDELRNRLATFDSVPEARSPSGYESDRLGEQFRAFLRYFTPHDVGGAGKCRIGGKQDGGYVMLDDFGAARNAISLGIGSEVSWDLDMAGRGLRVFQYDHSVAAPPGAHPNFRFHRNRVVGRRSSPEDVTLAQILTQRELVDDRDVMVKMDIDEAEWDVLSQTSADLLQRIRQLTAEFGEMRMFVDRDWRTAMLAAMKNLTGTHTCIHVHGNNWSPFAVVGGVPVPNHFEATFVRRSDHAISRSSDTFPTRFDVPNNPKRPDYFLGRWDY